MAAARRTRDYTEDLGLRERETELLRGEVSPRAGHGRMGDLVQLHLCPDCESELVYPTGWGPVGRNRWRVELRCPECEWHGGGVHAQDVIDRFDRVLDEGTDALLDDLTRLTRANLEEEVESFSAALRADLVLPEDF